MARLSICFFLVCGLSAATPVAQPDNRAYVDSAAYVNSAQCGNCHAAIAATYRHSGMARAFSHPSAQNTLENYAKGLPYYHAATAAYYLMGQRGGRYYQTRWQNGPGGKKINLQEWQIDFIMGSGNHVRTYLHRDANGTLLELPLAWYSEKGGYWAMNPGYDADHFITPRKIAYECMFCHNAYPRIPAGHEKENSVPAYLDPMPEGIDCQRCHGPGAAHVRDPKVRQSIVNPARLSGDQQMEICMQCHLQSTSAPLPAIVHKFDRGPFSYRAGEPLSSFMLFFDRAPGAKTKFEIVNSVYRLRQSKCFLQSKGALTCLTCHDPHNIPRGEEAVRHYTAACRHCHSGAFDSLVAAGKHTRDAGCVACHMPKRRTDDVVHAVMTDHLIQRRKPAGDLLAALPEIHETDATAYHGPVVPYYPTSVDPLYAAVAQVEHSTNPGPGIQQLSAAIEKEKPANAQFYFQLAEAWRAKGDVPRAIAAYRQAVQHDPGAAWTLRRLADALLTTGGKSPAASEAEAMDILNRAVGAAPDDARGWYALGSLDADTGRKSEAIAAFEKAAKLDPDLADADNALGGLLAESGKMQDAENAFLSALRVEPDLADANANLALIVAAHGDLAGAADHLERALKANPGNATARCNYAIALVRLNRPADAVKQLELALKTDPNFGEAHVDLGILLAGTGNTNGAVEHLRKAASSADPAIRQRAIQALQQMGK